jgi:hypothetical protein
MYESGMLGASSVSYMGLGCRFDARLKHHVMLPSTSPALPTRRSRSLDLGFFLCWSIGSTWTPLTMTVAGKGGSTSHLRGRLSDLHADLECE